MRHTRVPFYHTKNYIVKEEIKVVKEKQTFHDKFIKDLQDNTPHAGQFDEEV